MPLRYVYKPCPACGAGSPGPAWWSSLTWVDTWHFQLLMFENLLVFILRAFDRGKCSQGWGYVGHERARSWSDSFWDFLTRIHTFDTTLSQETNSNSQMSIYLSQESPDFQLKFCFLFVRRATCGDDFLDMKWHKWTKWMKGWNASCSCSSSMTACFRESREWPQLSWAKGPTKYWVFLLS